MQPSRPPSAPPQEDLDLILEHARDVLSELMGARLFVTGGTGFFGTWLLHALAHANDRLKLGLQMLVLSRDPKRFAAQHPALGIGFHTGDIETFEFPDGKFTHVIHAATPASAALNEQSPAIMFKTVVRGTERALEFARQSGATRFLFTSSGAVYGKQPATITHVDESYPGAPDPLMPASAYGEAKRSAELLCSFAHRDHGIEAKIARCFAFVGPYLPLDTHFAVGNFMRDAMAGGPIRIRGDGTPYRSYLYASDLVIWLLTVLVRGQPCRPYNVGSEQDLSIADIARAVAGTAERASGRKTEVIVEQEPTPGHAPERYVPSTRRASKELGLKQTMDLAEAVRRTMKWYRDSAA